jgi:hypothetical protein
MWPFSTIRELRAQVTKLEARAEHLDSQLSIARSYAVSWADKARLLQAKLDEAEKNDARDPKTGRFKKATGNG